jgi:hypothetical protein
MKLVRSKAYLCRAEKTLIYTNFFTYGRYFCLFADLKQNDLKKVKKMRIEKRIKNYKKKIN